jgi:uncharacterized protein (TIGR03067 family)
MFAYILTTSASLIFAPIPQGDDAAKVEQKQWQGAWKIQQMEIVTGDRTARLKFKAEDEAAWRVKEDLLEIIGLNFPYSAAKIRFDSARDPKHLTLILQDGSKPGPTVEASYTRDGDGDGVEIEIVKWPRGKDGETSTLRLTLKRVKE